MDEQWLTDFLTAYVACELWSGSDWGHESDDVTDEPCPLDDNYGPDDLTDAARWQMLEDCSDFVAANWADLCDLEAEQCGHDFSLTRNGHGAGFWDRGLGALGERLSDAARVYGETNYYGREDGSLDLG